MGAAVEALTELGALGVEEALTPLGRHLAHLPCDARLAKALLYGAMLRCALLSVVTRHYLVTLWEAQSCSPSFLTDVQHFRKHFRLKHMQSDIFKDPSTSSRGPRAIVLVAACMHKALERLF